jgi:hypothetical protein
MKASSSSFAPLARRSRLCKRASKLVNPLSQASGLILPFALSPLVDAPKQHGTAQGKNTYRPCSRWQRPTGAILSTVITDEPLPLIIASTWQKIIYMTPLTGGRESNLLGQGEVHPGPLAVAAAPLPPEVPPSLGRILGPLAPALQPEDRFLNRRGRGRVESCQPDERGLHGAVGPVVERRSFIIIIIITIIIIMTKIITTIN